MTGPDSRREGGRHDSVTVTALRAMAIDDDAVVAAICLQRRDQPAAAARAADERVRRAHTHRAGTTTARCTRFSIPDLPIQHVCRAYATSAAGVGEAVASRRLGPARRTLAHPNHCPLFCVPSSGAEASFASAPPSLSSTWVRRQEKMPVQDCLGDVHELVPAVARVVTQHRKCLALVDLVALHQDPLGALGLRPPPKAPCRL